MTRLTTSKGITPVIAIVLLLLITVGAVAAIWSMSSQLMNSNENQPKPWKTDAVIKDVSCGRSSVEFLVRNTGEAWIDTSNVRIEVKKPDGSYLTRETGINISAQGLSPGENARFAVFTSEVMKDSRNYAVTLYFDSNQWQGTDTCTSVEGSKTVGLWKFNGDARDSSGEGNHGTLQDSPSWVTGKFGQAVEFDGSNDYIEVPHDSSLNMGNTEQLSISAWVKPATSSPGYQGVITKNRPIAYESWYGLWIASSGDQWHWRTGEDGWTYSTEHSVGKWHHVVVTVNNETKIKEGYVNGHKVYRNNYSGSLMTDGGASLRIGAAPYPNEYFNGQIDEVHIYDRILQ